MKKFLILLISAALAASVCAGCENVEYKDDSSDIETSDTYSEIEDLLPDPISEDASHDERYNYICSIVTENASVFVQSEDSPTLVNTAIQERANLLEERYSITVEAHNADYSTIANDIKAAVESGLDYCDLLAVSQENTVKLYLAGLLYDMNKLEKLDLNSGLFDGRNAASLATGQSLYMIPDASTYSFESLNVMFYNRDMIGEDLTDPQILVQRGEWTWDKMLEYGKSAAYVNGGIYGYANYYEGDDYAYPMWMSAGRYLVKDTYKNDVKMAMTGDEIAETADKLYGYKNVTYISPKYGADAAKAFEEGKTAFLTHTFNYFYALRDGSDKGLNFGFLPMPKLNAEQDGYYCLAGNESRVYSMPATLEYKNESERERSYVLLAIICGVSSEPMKKAFVGTVLVDYLYDNLETVTLQTIIDSATYDFTAAYGPQIKNIGRATFRAVCDKLTYNSKVQTSVSRALDAFELYAATYFNKSS